MGERSFFSLACECSGVAHHRLTQLLYWQHSVVLSRLAQGCSLPFKLSFTNKANLQLWGIALSASDFSRPGLGLDPDWD